MSLWTPSGEHPVGEERRRQAGEPPIAGGGPAGPGGGGGPGDTGDTGGPGPDGFGSAEADVEALRRQLADAPAEVVVANHCYGLFELAAVYLSQTPPRLDGARLAIDALGVLVDGLSDRLGEAHSSLRDALAQLRLAYVQIASVAEQPGDGTPVRAAGNGTPSAASGGATSETEESAGGGRGEGGGPGGDATDEPGAGTDDAVTPENQDRQAPGETEV